MKILVSKSDMNIKFMYELMQVLKYDIGGHERHWISKFALILIDIPTIPEQTKIANFLSAIDDKINHTQKQIEKAEIWKKGLMQQMFV
jgi:type I restriction enzyme S subunit